MTTRLDLALQRHPDHESGIRMLAARDPSGSLKYLDWAGKTLASGQALAPEIADILDLFHKFRGRSFDERARGRHVSTLGRIHPDVHTYRPQDLATLRTNLLKVKRAQDAKRKKRERLYRIEGEVDVDVVYDSPDLIIRHIRNKQASVHYGLGTRWCVAMLREGYFDDYDSQNAIFYFFERKSPIGDEFDKVAVMVPRRPSGPGEEDFAAFTATDSRIGLLALAKVYGACTFDILRRIYESSERYPGSDMACVYAGSATAKQIEKVFALVAAGGVGSEITEALLEAVVCNDEAPQSLVHEIARRGVALAVAAHKRDRRGGRRRHRRMHTGWEKEFEKTLAAALVIHPNVEDDLRKELTADLRRRRVALVNIRRTVHDGRVGIRFDAPDRVNRAGRPIFRRLRRRRRLTPSQLRAVAGVLDRRADRCRKLAEKVEQKKLTLLVDTRKKKAKRR